MSLSQISHVIGTVLMQSIQRIHLALVTDDTQPARVDLVLRNYRQQTFSIWLTSIYVNRTLRVHDAVTVCLTSINIDAI